MNPALFAAHNMNPALFAAVLATTSKLTPDGELLSETETDEELLDTYEGDHECLETGGGADVAFERNMFAFSRDEQDALRVRSVRRVNPLYRSLRKSRRVSAAEHANMRCVLTYL